MVRDAVRFKANEIAEDVRGLLQQTIVSSTEAHIEYGSTLRSNGVDTSGYKDAFENANEAAFINQVYQTYCAARARLRQRYGISFRSAGEDGGWVRKLGLEMPPVLKAMEEVSVKTTIPVRQFIRAWELYLKYLELKHDWNKRVITSDQLLGRKLANRAECAERFAIDRLSVVPMLKRWVGYGCLAETLIEDRKDLQSCSVFNQETNDRSNYGGRDPREVYLNAIRRCGYLYFEHVEEADLIDFDRSRLQLGRIRKIRVRDEIRKGGSNHLYLKGYLGDRRDGLTVWLGTVRHYEDDDHLLRLLEIRNASGERR